MISILIPVYNTDVNFIKECFDSINNQTFTQYEVIVVNDGSNEVVTNFLVAFEKENLKYKIIHKNHEGISQALNIGLQNCNNDIVARMDADDIMHPKRLEKQYEYFNKHNIDILGCQVHIFDNITQDIIQITNHKQKILKQDILTGWFLNHPTVLFNKEKIINIGGYNPKFNGMEDLELWCRSLHNGLKIENMEDSLLLYRRHQFNATINEISNKNFQQLKFNMMHYYLNLESTK